MANQELYKVAIPEIQYPFRVNLFMWPNKTLFFGPLNHLALHSLGSLAINIGVYKPFYIRTEKSNFMPTRCVVIPAGCRHEMLGYGNVVASLIIERTSPEFSSFNKHISFHNSFLTEIHSEKWVNCFKEIYEEKPSKDEVNRLIGLLFRDNNDTEHNIDPRLNRAIITMQSDSENYHSQDLLAASEGLSPSRFRHLFKEQLHVPYRNYRMWKKVLFGLNSFHKVDNLTHAAMNAGFSDSAHFNRCFRNTLGVNPSQIFKNIDRFEDQE